MLHPLRANASTGVTLLSVSAPACNEMVWGGRGCVRGWVWHPLTQLGAPSITLRFGRIEPAAGLLRTWPCLVYAMTDQYLNAGSVHSHHFVPGWVLRLQPGGSGSLNPALGL